MFCNAELEALQQHHDEFRELGARLVAISPQLPERNAEMKEKHGIDFPILTDHGLVWCRWLNLTYDTPEDLREVYRSFGIDVPEYNGDDSWELPLSARLVVDSQGILRSVEADCDYTRRPEPSATLDLLRSMQG